jgi:hypothetical protein
MVVVVVTNLQRALIAYLELQPEAIASDDHRMELGQRSASEASQGFGALIVKVDGQRISIGQLATSGS